MDPRYGKRVVSPPTLLDVECQMIWYIRDQLGKGRSMESIIEDLNKTVDKVELIEIKVEA
jgi:hypothetical protein